MRIHAHGGTVAHDICFAVKDDRSRIYIGVNGIDEDDSIFSRDLIDQIQGRGPQVGNFDAIFELVVGGQKARDVGPDAVIAEQDVSDPADQYLLHTLASQHLHLGNLAARRIEGMAGAGHARIERVHGTQDLQRFLGPGERRVQQ